MCLVWSVPSHVCMTWTRLGRLFAPLGPAALLPATVWRFVSRRNDVFDGEVIRVVTSSSTSSGMLLGSATVIVRVRGCSLRKKGTGVASTVRILRSGILPLALALTALLDS